jgi:seryl-tRNA synthetase
VIDLRLLRTDPEAIRVSQRARGENPDLVDQAVAADAAQREALTAFEGLRARQKSIGKDVAAAKGEAKVALLAETKDLAAQVKAAQAAASEAEAKRSDLLYQIPNVVEGAPVGGEADYLVIKEIGGQPQFTDFEPLPHWEMSEKLKAVDTERGAKVSGARFYFLTGIGARLELALLNCAMDLAVQHGFIPMITPTLVKPEIMRGTGFLGAHSDEIYRLERDDQYLVGTSEVALAGYYSDEIIDLSDGPIRFAGWSACYRREAGAGGRDTRGIIRVHQFHKVEMFSYCPPELATQEHLRLLAMEEEMLAKVELPYRVIDTAAGDLGTSAARKFDCEAWLPVQQRYLELTSTSNCSTFQARRLGVRERVESGETQTVATLNGTLATTRWLVAMFENLQQPDGSLRIPKALQPYLGGLEYAPALG